MGILINDSDQCFMDSIAQEVNHLAGVVAIFFQYEEKKSSRNPYYGESKDRIYKGGGVGVECPIFFKSPDRSEVTGEEGFRMDKTSSFFVARVDLDERSLRRPRVGDILKVWNSYFDVTKSSATEGRFSDTGQTLQYEVDVVRRTKSLPEGLRM